MAVLRTGRAVLVACVLVSGIARGAVTDDPRAAADVGRVLTLLNVVGEEYREGVVDGAVVLPIEYEEAKTFLAEAQSRLRASAPDAGAAADAQFAAAAAALASTAPLDDVRSHLDAIRQTIARTTGVVERLDPPAPPSVARGRALFAENCTPCHGEHADGNGAEAARFNPPPANFGDPEFMRRETPFSFFNIITAGKGTSAMPAWGDVLSLQERWDLVSFLYTVESGQRLVHGREVYAANCAGCHGLTGDMRAGNATAPLNLPGTLARQTDDEIFAALADDDVPGHAFTGRLSAPQLWAAVSYARALSLGGGADTAVAAVDAEAPRRFAGLLRLLGEEYRRAVAPGAPINEAALTQSATLLERVRRQSPRVEQALADRDPTAATAMNDRLERIGAAIGSRRPAAEVSALIAPVADSIEAHAAAATDAGQASAAAVLAQTRQLLEQALAAYRGGDERADYLVSDAYFLFDPLEKQLALADADLARRIETRFGELRGLMGAPGHERDVTEATQAITADLARAALALAPRRSSAAAVALQSGFIILREGFEVVLVVGALLAYVRKSGLPAMRAPILWGTAAGAAASAATAWALVTLFQASGATAEVIEGATMLLAAAVLFFVSYWLIAKAEADRWQRYIQGKVKAALATGNVLALAGAAFLAVYREGTETILFYKALIDSAPAALGPLAGGFLAGVAGLAVVYVLYARLGARLPLRQFFLVTGALLYYLAVVFAGKGIAELQAAGWVSTTPVPVVPRIDLIGLHPTAETLIAQGALLLCVLYAVVVTLRRARRAETAERLDMNVASHGGAKL